MGLRREALEPRNLESGIFKEQAALFHEGLELLPDQPSAQRAALEELLALARFFDAAAAAAHGRVAGTPRGPARRGRAHRSH